MLRLLAILLVAACSRPGAKSPPPPPDAAPPPADAAPAPQKPCARPGRQELAPGLVVDRVAADAERCITLVRIDPARYRVELRTAAADGGARPAPRWAADFGLAAVINTSMYHPDRSSIGLLRDARTVNNDRDNPKLGGFLLFDPVDSAKDPAWTIAGRPCDGFDLAALRGRWRGIAQNYRLLDCDGRAIPWADEKIYSAAAIAVDADGWLVFVHSRAPFKMTDFSAALAAPALRLRGAVYVEGGPEASLYARAGDAVVEEVGSFETGFHDGTNRFFWDIPNVLGAVPQSPTQGTLTRGLRPVD